MKLNLYHYVHCPFCVRVRMTLSLLKLPFTSTVLPYNDEKTPVDLSGTKMLPIMVIDGKAMNESLDIMAALDKEKALRISETIKSEEFKAFNNLLTKLGTNVHNLAMPYWIYTPEFSEDSRQYFQNKKEQKRGPFKELVKNQSQYIKDIETDFSALINELKPFYKSETFSLYDILLAAHIWGLYVVPEFQFTPKLHDYLQKVKAICHFNYHEDFWK